MCDLVRCCSGVFIVVARSNQTLTMAAQMLDAATNVRSQQGVSEWAENEEGETREETGEEDRCLESVRGWGENSQVVGHARKDLLQVGDNFRKFWIQDPLWLASGLQLQLFLCACMDVRTYKKIRGLRGRSQKGRSHQQVLVEESWRPHSHTSSMREMICGTGSRW